MLRKIIVFMLELILILFLGVIIVSIIAGVVQGLVIGSGVSIVALALGLYTATTLLVLANMPVIIGGLSFIFVGYITYRVLTDED